MRHGEERHSPDLSQDLLESSAAATRHTHRSENSRFPHGIEHTHDPTVYRVQNAILQIRQNDSMWVGCYPAKRNHQLKRDCAKSEDRRADKSMGTEDVPELARDRSSKMADGSKSTQSSDRRAYKNSDEEKRANGLSRSCRVQAEDEGATEHAGTITKKLKEIE